jgi:kynurenine 3-monooxygenase
MASHVIISGAGLAGTLLALRMADRGHTITLLEKRGDLRTENVAAGRSINLALSDRGLAALDLVGLRQAALDISIPMYGRLIHPRQGRSKMLLPYSGREGEYIQSISRPGLNALLLEAASRNPAIGIHFHHGVDKADIFQAAVTGRHMKSGDPFHYKGDVLIGTDGAGSEVRGEFLHHGAFLRFNYSQQWLDHGYKELEIPAGPGGTWQIEKNALHIWPRQNFMLIALPNLDGSFTVTLFLPFDGKPGFNQLTDEASIMAFFREHFPDIIPLMPDLAAEFLHHPTGALGTVKCYPWSTTHALVMGDAAHAVVPFYGQGMNCAMEDVIWLDRFLDESGTDWPVAFRQYEKHRKKDTDAIADLAVENYYEMRDHVDNPDFITKRKIEMELERLYPDFGSKYNLVTFSEHVPYSEARRKGNLQDVWLLEYCRRHPEPDLSPENLEHIYRQLKTL